MGINQQKDFVIGEAFKDFNNQFSRANITTLSAINVSLNQQLTVVAVPTGIGANVGATFNIVEKI